jgi:hypothetical protein
LHGVDDTLTDGAQTVNAVDDGLYGRAAVDCGKEKNERDVDGDKVLDYTTFHVELEHDDDGRVAAGGREKINANFKMVFK